MISRSAATGPAREGSVDLRKLGFLCIAVPVFAWMARFGSRKRTAFDRARWIGMAAFGLVLTLAVMFL